MASRKFYHVHKEPEVHFTAAGKIYSGLLASYWRDGVQLVIRPAPAFEVQQRLTGVHFSRHKRLLAGPDLRVTHLVSDPACFRVDTRICDSEDARWLEETLHRLENGDESTDPSVADPSALPRFTGKEHYALHAVAARIAWVEQICGTKLEHLTHNGLKPESLAGNIENYIGAVQIPVGIAGPIRIKGLYIDGYVPVPVAATEGALVSSISRGAAVCNLAGGIDVHVSRQTMVRAPVFFCSDMAGAINLDHWIRSHLEEIRNQAESVSSVARLDQIRSHLFDNTLHVQFYYSTGDASGQNMTSACTFMACRWIKNQVDRDPAIGLESYMVEGNLSGDKKVNVQNFTLGRGIAATATCRIPGDLLQARLRVTPHQFVRCYQAGEVGALQSGMMGSNINFANIIAGVFSATGQDIASVHESAAGYFKARQQDDDLVVTAYLPSLVIGTVGGGTRLPAQQECLKIMGCYGNGKVFRLAEIIAAACLALDLSTGAAVMANEFVPSHEQFGRNRPNHHLSWAHIDTAFFGDLLADDEAVVESADRGELDTRNAILSEAARAENRGVRGLFRYHLRLRSNRGVHNLDAVLKIKPPGRELVDIGTQVARLTGEDVLGGLFESQSHIFSLDDSNIREITIYNSADARFHPYWPRIYGTRCDDDRQFYAILMEDLAGCLHLNDAVQQDLWHPGHIAAALQALADMHAVYWNRQPAIPRQIPLPALDPSAYQSSEELLAELTAFNAGRYPHLLGPVEQVLKDAIQELPAMLHTMRQHPMTLTHNDFNPRNVCLRRHDGGMRAVVYDWELAKFQNPHHDLAEFLVFALPPEAPMDVVDHYGRYYFGLLVDRVDRVPPWNEFQQGLALNAVEMALVRFNLYLMGHNLLNFGFMDRVYGNLVRVIRHYRRHL